MAGYQPIFSKRVIAGSSGGAEGKILKKHRLENRCKLKLPASSYSLPLQNYNGLAGVKMDYLLKSMDFFIIHSVGICFFKIEFFTVLRGRQTDFIFEKRRKIEN
jgi:hypothetical protein